MNDNTIYVSTYSRNGESYDDGRINRAINDCLSRGKGRVVLDEPNYTINNTIKIQKQGYADISLEGQGLVDIKSNFNGPALLITNVKQNNVDPYPERIQNVDVKDIRFTGTGRSEYNGVGVQIQYFGFIRLINVICTEFGYGHKIMQGSEMSLYNCRFAGNYIGGTFEGIQDNGAKEIANVMSYSCIYDNNIKETMILKNTREINIYGGALMNTGNAVSIITNGMINFYGCDFENYNKANGTHTNSLYIRNGQVFVQNCMFANRAEDKIVMDGGELTLTNNTYDMETPKTLTIRNKSCVVNTKDKIYVNDETKGVWNCNYNLSFLRETPLNAPFFRNGTNISPWVANRPFANNGGTIKFDSSTMGYIELSHPIVPDVAYMTVETKGSSKKGYLRCFDMNGNVKFLYQVGFVMPMYETSDGWTKQIVILNEPVKSIMVGSAGSETFEIRNIKLFGYSAYRL